MARVFNALEWRRTRLRGAVNRVKKPGNNARSFECDLRLRFRHRLVLTSLKTGDDLRRVRGYHKPRSRIVGSYRRAAVGGRWLGPHPRYRKSARARFVGMLSVTPNAWRLDIYRKM